MISFSKKTVPYRVYIDFDDVLCETAKLLLNVAKSEFGKQILFEDIHSFDIGKTFEASEQEAQHIMDVMHKPKNLLAIPPITMAAETIRNWVEHGVKVDIVTGRPPFTEESSRGWLQKHEVPYSDIIFVNKYASNKNGFRYHAEAITLDDLKKRHYDLAIDDSSSMLQFLFNEMDMDIAIFNRPWNATLKFPAQDDTMRKIHRCQSWQDITGNFNVI